MEHTRNRRLHPRRDRLLHAQLSSLRIREKRVFAPLHEGAGQARGQFVGIALRVPCVAFRRTVCIEQLLEHRAGIGGVAIHVVLRPHADEFAGGHLQQGCKGPPRTREHIIGRLEPELGEQRRRSVVLFRKRIRLGREVRRDKQRERPGIKLRCRTLRGDEDIGARRAILRDADSRHDYPHVSEHLGIVAPSRLKRRRIPPHRAQAIDSAPLLPTPFKRPMLLAIDQLLEASQVALGHPRFREGYEGGEILRLAAELGNASFALGDTIRAQTHVILPRPGGRESGIRHAQHIG